MNSVPTDFPTLEKDDRAFDKLTLFGASTALGQLIMMVYLVILARHLGPGLYGTYVASFSLASLTSIVFNLGLDIWLLKEGPLAQNQDALTRNVLWLKLLIGAVWAALTLTLAVRIRPDLFTVGLLAICIVDVWFDSVFSTLLIVLNLRRRIKAYAAMLLLFRGAKLLSLIVFVSAGSYAVWLVAGLRALISVVSVVASLVLLRLNLGPSPRPAGLTSLRSSTPYNLSNIFAMVYMQADVNLITLIRGKLEAGIYAPALSLVNALYVLPNAVFTYSVPLLSRDFHAEQEGFTRTARRILLITAVLGLALFALVWAFGEDLIRLLLGSAYMVTGQVLVLLSPLLALKGLEFGLISIIVASDLQKKRLLPQALAALANIGLNLLLIPRLGLLGAAYAYLISEAIIFIGYGIIVAAFFWKRKNDNRT